MANEYTLRGGIPSEKGSTLKIKSISEMQQKIFPFRVVLFWKGLCLQESKQVTEVDSLSK